MSPILDFFKEESLQELVEELRIKLDEMKNHQVFLKIRSIEDLRVFMSWHVFAVWDFMLLVKALQFHYTSIKGYWVPPKNNASARLINEIVLGEETDDDGDGGYCSHFELYTRSMTEIGASTTAIDDFIERLRIGVGPIDAMASGGINIAIRRFVSNQVRTAQNGTIDEILGNFIFGREDSIPEMFLNLLDKWGVRESKAPTFVFYLKRHIELDKDAHGPAALAMLVSEVGDDVVKQRRALVSAIKAVKERIALWDGITDALAVT